MDIVERKEKMRIISQNLRMLREQRFPGRGGSKRCAEAMELQQQQWSPWEKGTRLPNKIRLEKIAAFFEVGLDYLLTNHSQESLEAGEADDVLMDQSQQHAPNNNKKKITRHEVCDDDAITSTIKNHIASSLNAKNIKAVLKLELSVVGLEFTN